MDNGLIFPYRRSTAHTESGDTNHPKLTIDHLRVFTCEWRVGSEPVVGKRINRGDA